MSKCECWTDNGVPPVKWICAECQKKSSKLLMTIKNDEEGWEWSLYEQD